MSERVNVPLAELAEKGAVTPAGTPATDIVMVDLKPLCGVTTRPT